MCADCIARMVLGIGYQDEYEMADARAAVAAFPVTSEMLECRQLVARLYDLPNCSTGGPLHIATDDYNLEDDNLDYCARDIEEQWSVTESPPERRAEIVQVVEQILALLRPMTLAQRALSMTRGATP